jgi:subtilisin family serine protease
MVSSFSSPEHVLQDELPEFTGRYLVTFSTENVNAAELSGLFKNNLGVEVGVAADYTDQPNEEEVLYPDLGIGIVTLDTDQQDKLSALADTENSLYNYYEPERYVYALGGSQIWRTALNAYLAGAQNMAQYLETLETDTPPSDINEPDAQTVFSDTPQLTWGLQAIGIGGTRLTGRGVKVAILDTGMDLQHPDFQGRSIISQSFIASQSVQDSNGHGTHCTGTACGPAIPRTRVRRYGVAAESSIYIGKVLSNEGRGTDGSIIAGIQWALRHGCKVISMSLGGRPGREYSRTYEQLANYALSQNCLLIAAAGNDSRRPGNIQPVSHPANCPSILAVGALNQRLDIAPFSNGQIYPDAKVDIAAPGVNVFSSWTRGSHQSIPGTSMATPHVAGIAALLFEKYPQAGANQIWRRIVQLARPIPVPIRDAGAGLAQVPR